MGVPPSPPPSASLSLFLTSLVLSEASSPNIPLLLPDMLLCLLPNCLMGVKVSLMTLLLKLFRKETDRDSSLHADLLTNRLAMGMMAMEGLALKKA